MRGRAETRADPLGDDPARSRRRRRVAVREGRPARRVVRRDRALILHRVQVAHDRRERIVGDAGARHVPGRGVDPSRRLSRRGTSEPRRRRVSRHRRRRLREPLGRRRRRLLGGRRRRQSGRGGRRLRWGRLPVPAPRTFLDDRAAERRGNGAHARAAHRRRRRLGGSNGRFLGSPRGDESSNPALDYPRGDVPDEGLEAAADGRGARGRGRVLGPHGALGGRGVGGVGGSRRFGRRSFGPSVLVSRARDALERPPLLRHHLAHLRLGLLPAGLVPSEPGLYPPRRVVLRLLLRLPPLLPSLGEVIANVWFERVVVVRVGEVLAPRRRVQRGERLGHDGGAAEAAIGVVAALQRRLAALPRRGTCADESRRLLAHRPVELLGCSRVLVRALEPGDLLRQRRPLRLRRALPYRRADA
mmetsp:Transcript_14329/g.58352  ORF Transcript_14329/g.58352 Transcript_14329/m.58352 type:complete len:416 (-) Transcript_14329:104-1351(-)